MKKQIHLFFVIIFISEIFLYSCDDKSKNPAQPQTHTSDTTKNSAPDPSYSNVDTGSHYYVMDSAFDEQSSAVPVNADPVEKKIDNLLVFHNQDTMQVNQTYKATLALSKRETLEKIKEDITNSGADDGNFYVDSTLKIASTMKAVLKDLNEKGEKNFEIDLIGDGTEVQDIDSLNDYKAFWQWSVRPLKEGSHKLELVVEIVVNRTRKIFLPSRTIPVTIYSTPESFWHKLAGFFEKNWQWMIGAVLIPFAVAWFNQRNATNAKQKQRQKIKKK